MIGPTEPTAAECFLADKVAVADNDVNGVVKLLKRFPAISGSEKRRTVSDRALGHIAGFALCTVFVIVVPFYVDFTFFYCSTLGL